MATVFTKIIQGDIPCYKICETSDYIAFLDIHPLTEGHTLIVPKVEVDYYFDLEPEAYIGCNMFAKELAVAIKKAVPCQRIGVAVVGLEVPHAHMHLIPVNHVDDMNFSRERLKLTPDELERIAANIREQISV